MNSSMRLLTTAVTALALALLGAENASAQYSAPTSVSMSPGQYYHYPYYYFPHSYWPTTGPKWPERPGEPYMRPPAYMAYPPFHEPHWRYELWQPRNYYRGFHFWLDQF
jgi:hypothetical protein